jgi:hypothetical protein
MELVIVSLPTLFSATPKQNVMVSLCNYKMTPEIIKESNFYHLHTKFHPKFLTYEMTDGEGFVTG